MAGIFPGRATCAMTGESPCSRKRSVTCSAEAVEGESQVYLIRAKPRGFIKKLQGVGKLIAFVF